MNTNATRTDDDATRVLIVDDVAASREALRRALSFDESIEVVGEAGSGDEAINQAEHLHPHLVLMDVRMPEVDGVQATRAIMTRLPGTKVVALTVHDDVGTIREMLEAGATGYFLKGGAVDDLLSAVHEARRGEARIDDRLLPSAIDELRRLLREERARREEVERLSRLRQEVMQVLSHELRTPLTVMGGALRFMARRDLTDEERSLLASAIQRAGELERIIEGLELIGEPAATRGAPADPVRAVGVACERLGEVPDEVRVEPDTWRGVRDRHLTRIALELVDNAIRHGRRPIEVSSSRQGRAVALTVSDAGNVDLAPDLVEAFAQGDMSATRERGGLGLGLFVAHRLCEADGGRLILRRAEGRTVAEARYELPAT
jgi:DNA-binding NarL/FixJ family response regulator